MTHLYIGAHSSTSSRRSPRERPGLFRGAAVVLALVAAITLVRGLETALNPTVPARVPTPTQSSPTPGFDD
jgi:hypothetical protein